MKIYQYSLILILLLGCAFGLHLELSKQFIGDVLDKESKALQVLIEEEWAKENLPQSVSIDYQSITTKAGQDLNHVEVSFNGQASKDGESSISFTVTVSVRLVANPSYSIYKNSLASEVVVSLQDNDKLKESITRTFAAFTHKMLDWTHENLNGTSGTFYSTHYLLTTMAKIAGRLYANDRAVFLDFSSRDLHFSTIKSDPKEVYDKLKGGPRYFGISASDKMFDELLKEFLRRRKMTDIRKFLGLFPDFDDFLPMLKLVKLEELMPELVEEWGSEKFLNFFLNIVDEDEDTKEILDKGNKVTFKKDAVEILTAFSFSMNVDVGERWELVRKGFIALRANIQMKMLDSTRIYTKGEGGIKSIKLATKDGEQMDVEEGAIKGLVNLLIKRNLKNQTNDISGLLTYLPCFGFGESVKFNAEPGFINLSVEKLGADFDLTNCPDSEGFKEPIETVSIGFQKAEQKKRTTYERKMQIQQYKSQHGQDKKEDL